MDRGSLPSRAIGCCAPSAARHRERPIRTMWTAIGPGHKGLHQPRGKQSASNPLGSETRQCRAPPSTTWVRRSRKGLGGVVVTFSWLCRALKRGIGAIIHPEQSSAFTDAADAYLRHDMHSRSPGPEPSDHRPVTLTA